MEKREEALTLSLIALLALSVLNVAATPANNPATVVHGADIKSVITQQPTRSTITDYAKHTTAENWVSMRDHNQNNAIVGPRTRLSRMKSSSGSNRKLVQKGESFRISP